MIERRGDSVLAEALAHGQLFFERLAGHET
jgi:hypothetical protein